MKTQRAAPTYCLWRTFAFTNIALTSLVVLISLNNSTFGLQNDAQPESADPLQLAAQLISQKSVTSTITFLASDELAGRDTPSVGLTIATAYVASRFRGAGLQESNEAKGYFQVSKIATTTIPSLGIKFTRDGQPLDHYGMLSASAEPFLHSGPIKFLDENDDFRNMKFDSPVCISAGKITNRRDRFNLARRTNILKRNGATAILIQIEPDSPLIGVAKQARKPRIVNPRGGGFAGSTLLVGKLEPGEVFQLQLPKQTGGETEVRNVIGLIPGSDPELAQEAIIFSAHLDHVGEQNGLPDPIFNGADDNATGVTAVLSLADAFAALPTAPKRTVVFMTFWGEEKGLLGSRHYVKNPIWPLDKTVANINIEMIGRPEPGANEKCWMTGWYQSDLGTLMNEASQKVGVRIFEHPRFSEMLYRASDNYSFVEKGVVAHSFSAGSLHQDYHQPGDHWEKLELRHMTHVIKGLFFGSLPIANGHVTPAAAKKQ